MACELCKLHTIIHLYEDHDPRWIILDCMSCVVPMVVWRASHTMTIPVKDYNEMEYALTCFADEKYGSGNYRIDKKQRSIPDHLHWHARPIDWVAEDLRLLDQQEYNSI